MLFKCHWIPYNIVSPAEAAQDRQTNDTLHTFLILYLYLSTCTQNNIKSILYHDILNIFA